MAQNLSHAVMAQRTESRDSLDFFPTPPWATRALCVYFLGHITTPGLLTVWEPACGAGDMAKPLDEYFKHVIASDIADYGYGERLDFLDQKAAAPICDWVITNPPFNRAAEFAKRGLWAAVEGVALLVRTTWLEGVGRYQTLFRDHPPAIIAQFSERVPMVKGRLDPKASSATAYCWVVWSKAHTGPTRLMWIPPCRKLLEREGDYQ